jgi:hypothetical protein
LYYLWRKENFTKPLNEHFVIISKIVPDEYNKGYENLQNSVVESINNTKVTTLEDIKNTFTQNPKKIIIKTKAHRGEIILGTEKLNYINKRIAKNYNI